ncbi:hypothetical protein D3C72_1710110 [compost metagenome]
MPTGLSHDPSAATESFEMMAVMPQSVRASESRNTADLRSTFMTTVFASGADTSVTFRPLRPSKSLRQRQSVFGSM